MQGLSYKQNKVDSYSLPNDWRDEYENLSYYLDLHDFEKTKVEKDTTFRVECITGEIATFETKVPFELLYNATSELLLVNYELELLYQIGPSPIITNEYENNSIEIQIDG